MTEPINYWELPEQWLNEPDDNDIPEDFIPPEMDELQPDMLEGE